MKVLEHNGCHIIYDPTLLAEQPQQCFDPDYWHQKGAVIGSARGRGTTWFLRGRYLELALRHYYRGGLFGKLVRDCYWFSGWEKTRSIEEFRLLQHLAGAGVRVPRPVAARVVRKHFLYQADLLTEKVPGAKDLVAVLQKQYLDEALWLKVGEMIQLMHQSGVCHTDLNAHNILLDGENQVWLIDFDKCHFASGDGWQKSNLARLHRSFVKEVSKVGIKWDETAWQYLMQGYTRMKGA
ncbi:3-deoxy-D-manno-octulosonic acid kinase [Photobacterium sanctipauli]|uniref:3-deoxy-D-manno-octulosonic acid kinase n=1 Tax=Photobacterium sanctipauli TaxID=1342794 RepID=A0A2T3NSV1_9GAMM|nr:3-deoxy-D-manno-octulosonic acid kinase [Photobacterium sanctipauli]PSW19285.1 3-deoxy-D-manno-octulosonic acid kinase [Photobacterium sanctipauli]